MCYIHWQPDCRALCFEVGGYSNKVDGDIKKVTHQRKMLAHSCWLSAHAHTQTHSIFFSHCTTQITHATTHKHTHTHKMLPNECNISIYSYAFGSFEMH